MQGKSSPERQILDAGAFCRGLVEDGTVYAFLADHRAELFRDEDFADLFSSGLGRPYPSRAHLLGDGAPGVGGALRP